MPSNRYHQPMGVPAAAEEEQSALAQSRSAGASGKTLSLRSGLPVLLRLNLLAQPRVSASGPVSFGVHSRRRHAPPTGAPGVSLRHPEQQGTGGLPRVCSRSAAGPPAVPRRPACLAMAAPVGLGLHDVVL